VFERRRRRRRRALLALFNAFLLVLGGAQWGASVLTVGAGVSLLILPISFVTRRLHARRLRNAEVAGVAARSVA
jgi:hypothetical protein